MEKNPGGALYFFIWGLSQIYVPQPPPCSPFIYFFWMKYVCPLPPLNVFYKCARCCKNRTKEQ